MGRKGMMVGTGKKGYHNVVGRDPAVHSQSAKGIKQPQHINIISPNALPIYKIGGQFYFRDERLGEYRNIKNPSDRKRIDDVNNSELQKWTKRDSDFIFGKEQLSPEDIKGLSFWVSDYKKAIHYQNIKLAKQIRDNIVKVLKEKGVEEPYKHEIWGKSNEWERNRTEEDGLVKRWFENPNDFNQVISVVDDPNISSEQDVRVTYKDKSGKYKNFEVRASKSIIENKNDAEIIDFVQKHIDRGAGKDSVLN